MKKLTIVPVAALLAFAALAVGNPSAALAGCHKSGKSVDNISKKTARNAIVCLFNKERSAPNVQRKGNLKQSAQRHAGVMASKNCYAHQCPGEPPLDVRVRQSGYLRGSSNYGLGEVIIYRPANASPRQLVNMWIGSPSHRATIRRSSFDHVGVGLSIRGGDVWAAADFGYR